MIGSSTRNQNYYRRRYRVADAYQEYEMRDRTKESLIFNNTLSGTHHFGALQADWRTSYSTTTAKTPYNARFRFRETGAYNDDLVDDQGPEQIPAGATNNIDETFFQEAYSDNENVKDNNLTGQIDLKYDFDLGDKISAYLKTGAKYRQMARSYDYNRKLLVNYNELEDYTAANPDRWSLDREGKILIDNFVQSYDSPEFLQGRYDHGLVLDVDKLNEFGEEFSPMYIDDETVDLQDYTAKEGVKSAYIMGEIKYKDLISFLPGVRVEQTHNDYSGNISIGVSSNGKQAMQDSTGENTYTEILPMLHLRIKPTDWFDIRFAATKTLARPSYYNLVPWENKSTSQQTIERGNPNLKHTSVWNYDTFLSFYNKHGLFTVGLFYKKLENIDYISTYYGEVDGNNYLITEPVNAEGTTIIKGFEVDFQTNLSYLPAPFDGIILSLNYSMIGSKTYYPLLLVENGPPPFYTPIITDTTRVNRMPGQASHIANASIGYEKGGFSTRLSFTYQGDALSTIGTREELDTYTAEFVRLDFTAQQKIDKHWRVFLNVNNLLNTPEKSYIGSDRRLSFERYYGLTADIGVRMKF